MVTVVVGATIATMVILVNAATRGATVVTAATAVILVTAATAGGRGERRDRW
ncbi:hypothetical protein AB0E69_15615 [Kribbella sp. NPDC026611]|uniref:hypothetical protein n=1 Tax=Kribbella sp. NPDC026611 TaxID=3154911 RepID=UPI0033EA2A71